MTEHKRVITYSIAKHDFGLHPAGDATYIASRTESPCFCFVEQTEKNAIAQAEAAIKSYIKFKLHED